MQRNKETVQYKQGTIKECGRSWIALEGLKHLSEKEIDKLIKEEPGITIGGYLAFLRELKEIEMQTEEYAELPQSTDDRWEFVKRGDRIVEVPVSKKKMK